MINAQLLVKILFLCHNIHKGLDEEGETQQSQKFYKSKVCMPDNINLKKDFREKPEDNPRAGEREVEGEVAVDIDPNAFAGLEEEERESPEPGGVAGPEAGPQSAGAIPTTPAPEVPAVSQEARNVVPDNLASITAPGAPVSRFKETLKAIRHPSGSPFENARRAGELFNVEENGVERRAS